MNISAVIITRNEEKKIKKCLNSLNFADELIVIDNNSSDKTVSLAKQFGAKVIIETKIDFSLLRNIGKEKATFEWLLYIDADEEVTSKLREEIINVSKNEGQIEAYYIPRKNYYFGVAWPKKEKMIRLMKKNALLKWQGAVHESAIISGKIGCLKNYLLHDTHRNLSLMVDKTNQWSEIESELLFRSNHPPLSWWRFLRMMVYSFCKSYFKDGGYRIGEVGLIESIYQSFSSYITYAKLWEKQNKLFKKKVD